MSTFFPKIEELATIPEFHFKYAEAILQILIKKILKLEEIDVGVYQEDRFGSVITFTDDEFENVIIDLKYQGGKYKLVVRDNSEDFGTSLFEYRISDHERLVEMIPSGLQEFMERVEEEQQEAVLRPGTLKGKV